MNCVGWGVGIINMPTAGSRIRMAEVRRQNKYSDKKYLEFLQTNFFKILSPIIMPKIIKWTKSSWKTFEEAIRPGGIRR
jgi:hypothetical protein